MLPRQMNVKKILSPDPLELVTAYENTMSSNTTSSRKNSSPHASPTVSKKRKSTQKSIKSSKDVESENQFKSSKHHLNDEESVINHNRAKKRNTSFENGKGPSLNLSISSESGEDNNISSGGEKKDTATRPSSTGDGKKSPLKSVTQIVSPASSFKPPPGFQLEDSETTSAKSKLFSKSNLDGKQIWYFTAPVSFSISSLTEVPMASIENGAPVVQHNGDEYGFSSEPTDCRNLAQILTPKAHRHKYSIVSKPVTRIMHLQRIIELPGVSLGHKIEGPRDKVPISRLARPQPKGLRMRFHPFGTSMTDPGNISSSSSSEDNNSITSGDEMKEAPLTFKPPPILPPSKNIKDNLQYIKDRKASKATHGTQNSPHRRK